MAEYDAEKHICPIHEVPFKRHTKDDKVWYSHKDGDGWCNEDKKVEKPKTESVKPAPKPVMQPAPREPFKADPDKSLSIENQVRAKIIEGLWEAGKIDEKHILAKKLVLWLGTLVPMSDKLFESVKAPEKPVVKKSVEPAQQEAALPIVESQVDRPEGMPATIKTGAQLAAYVGKHGINLAQFNATAQCAPNAITTEEQLIAAWNVLAPKLVK